ncbi:hypothetical protein F5876DRAFT_67260 [Lentinula aff. lateritia]|uniref:Uncharacterized protein n=1 Tax=Lentinula aff. lateritia TaxID=2804960 RepID=A0ACC1TUZ5_9AGAR|nr:hypothetical protein F5876DRAFT_67260 [Lentinula aff. lateritia]
MRTYLETVFSTFQLGAEYSLGDSLKPWLEIIDNHEQRITHAEREGRRRGPRQERGGVRLPGVEALLAGQTSSETQDGDGPSQPPRSRSATPLPPSGEPRSEDDSRQTRPERSSNGRARFEEEVPRTRSERRNHHHSSDKEDESDDEGRGEKPTKCTKQDKTLFNWAADAFIKRSILSPKHRKIIQEIENFKLDLDEAIESIEQSGVNPIFPKRLWNFDDGYVGVEERSEVEKQQTSESNKVRGSRSAESESTSDGNVPSLPRFMRGLGFRDDTTALRSRTASFTEFDNPLPRPASAEFENLAWDTIQKNPHLFQVQTPINADRLERMLHAHPNQPFVNSIVVTTGMPTRDEAREGKFNEKGRKRYASGTTLRIRSLCCFMDDCFSIALVGDVEVYEPYNQTLPSEQVKLLRLWDFLGIPHKQPKQVWGETLTIIGFLVDPNELTVTLPASSKDELVVQVKKFAASRRRTLQEWQQLTSWVNWSLNVFPLLRPALSNVYDKMKGKSNQSAQIFVNRAVRDDLTWGWDSGFPAVI